MPFRIPWMVLLMAAAFCCLPSPGRTSHDQRLVMRYQAALGHHPERALEAARALHARHPRDPVWRQQLAEALLEAAAMPETPRQRRAEFLRESEDLSRTLADTAEGLASLGVCRFFLGRDVEALDAIRRAFERGLADADRAANLANLAGWICWRAGDGEGCMRWNRRALDELDRMEARESGWMPRWEYFNLYLDVFGGVPASVAVMRQREMRYEELTRLGIPDRPDFRDSRRFMLRLVVLQVQGRLAETHALLLAEVGNEPRDILRHERTVASGEDDEAWRPRSYFRGLADDQDAVMCRLLLARICNRLGRRVEAARWLREARSLAARPPLRLDASP